MGDIDHGPCFLDLFAEGSDGGLVLLRQLEGRLHFCCIVDDLAVQLPTLLDQPLLLVVGLF